MAKPTFYHSKLTVTDTEVLLDTNELQHARQSRRLKVGSQVHLLNGKGLVANGKIKELSKRDFIVELVQHKMLAPPRRGLTVAVAVPKGDRQRFMVESITQLGVAKIQPIEYARSISSNVKATLKWQRYAIEAIKQSQNPWLPEVCKSLTLPQWLDGSQIYADSLKVMAEAIGTPLSEILENDFKVKPSIVVIGPEGGLTEEEKKALTEVGFSAMTLGTNILRIEVAAISCVAQWQGHVNAR